MIHFLNCSPLMHFSTLANVLGEKLRNQTEPGKEISPLSWHLSGQATFS